MKIHVFKGVTGLGAIAFIVCLLIFGLLRHQENQKIKIGVIAPLTGHQARNGQAMKRGFDLACEEKNEKESRIISLEYQDSKDNPNTGLSAAERLISIDKVKAILGDSRSAVTKTIADATDKKNIILFSSISTSDILSQNTLFFRNVPRNELQAETAYLFIKNHLKLHDIAIFNKVLRVNKLSN